MTANNIQTFTLGRAFGDVGNALGESTTKTYRALASLEGRVRRQQLEVGRLLPVRPERRAPGCEQQHLHLAHA